MGALGKGTLPAATRERIALAIAEINGCSYCLSAHSYLGKNSPKLDEAEIAGNPARRPTIPRQTPPCALQRRSQPASAVM